MGTKPRVDVDEMLLHLAGTLELIYAQLDHITGELYPDVLLAPPKPFELDDSPDETRHGEPAGGAS
jgi:hypothetical protein